MARQRFEFTDPKGMHFSQQMCNDVLDFVAAAQDLDNPRGRDCSLLRMDSKVGDHDAVTSVGAQFDAALTKLMGHFGLHPAQKADEPEPKKGGKRRRA